MWTDLAAIANNSLVASSPLVIIGDFNQILTAEEHFSLQSYELPVRGMTEFHECLEGNNLSDMDFRGTFFSWLNRRPEDPILRKLDRALCNDKWREVYPVAVTVFEAPGDSDHSPAIVSFSTLPEVRKCSFKYFSFISTHPRYLEEMVSTWQEEIPVGSKMFSLGQRLKNVKALCRKLNKEGFGNIQQKARDSMNELKEIQEQLLSSPTDSLFHQEFVARKKWQFFESAQEIFFSRKARVRWQSCGDANTTFFYKAVLAHQLRNSIRCLVDGTGHRIFSQDQIKDMAVAYFHNLLGSVDNEVVAISEEELRGLQPYRCPFEVAEKLILLPTDEEIIGIWKGTPKNKAPGPDGLVVEFFWEAWEVVGRDAVEAIKEFFSDG